MARFDVYPHPDTGQRGTTPFLLDVQNEYISGLHTRAVLPLRRAERVAIPLRDLNPALEVDGVAVILDAAAIGAVPLSLLKSPVANLRAQADLITNALDALFGGY
ncbi:CcdB family protein [Acidovorax sp. RAC01]|uniref:CcdB family protein n=1 Tax=Acidovorax sp. RAC01 TaxID=1842533 RepID=UPI00083E70B6|nr:CcdB family protein [Acidovorax sp. RAC01]AOG23044.1 ccdB family protein [Acidovorax sp. RAC01]